MSFVVGAASVGAGLLLMGVPAPKPSPVEPSPRPAIPERSTPSEAPALDSPAPARSPDLPLESGEEESFSYDPIDLESELIEPVPDVETFFEDFLEEDYHEDLVTLGERLFHDPRLSSDNTLSCASCHDLRYGGIDRAVTATGVNGQIGPINTPTVFNAAFNVLQFWDGRAANLEEQADGPPNAPGEMASNWDEITAKLAKDADLVSQLVKAFPKEDFSNGIDPEHLLTAIGEFERTLITPNSPFDRYLKGDDRAVSREAKEGYQLFKDVGCIECHNGTAVGGGSLQVLGRRRSYFKEHAAGVNLGRFNVTGEDEDRYRFKVPSLRNIALTAPYLHDGTQQSLQDVVRVMGAVQLDVDLSDAQVERLVAFLESLTGEYRGMSLDSIQNIENLPSHEPQTEDSE